MTSSMSPEELRELTSTRFVPHFDMDSDQLETIRAGSSVPKPEHSVHRDVEIIEGNGQMDDVLLEEHPSRLAMSETPKLIVKRSRVTAVPNRDEAVKILRKLQITSAEEIREERFEYYSQRWFYTSRDSEIELMEYVLLQPNHRPYFFSMQSRCLDVDDISRLIQTSLLAGPRVTGQCLARFAIKPTIDMPFQVLFGILKSLQTKDEIQVSDCVVTAELVEVHEGKKTTSRMRTTNCEEYGELEPVLDSQGKLMTSKATMTCSVRGQRHVQVQVSYFNNHNSVRSDTRNRFIELEQTVKCMSRPRVLIAEEQNSEIEFEVEKTLVPLCMGVPPVEDLIEVLKEDLHE